ncbi:putative cyclin-D6-1 [Neltuma alba]|uniref:putative cyclin-D6-1 n=1 Tax=Neltuma alba TaxID=207710 RepID=UPI0010A3F8FB|nr:putative cyclin-D6-1 [Prosopis alba]
MEFDLEDPLASFEEQQNCSISELFACESDHMPTQNCISFRCEAVSLISQVQFSSNLDPLGTYLAINYLDRFVSRREIKKGKPWFLRLIVISCLSLASKMTNTPFPISDLQIEGCMFEAGTIQKMENLILGALEWRMRSITPFSFLHFFISLAEIELKDPSSKQALKERASEIIFNAHYDIKFVGFKPSTVAASALICASGELFPQQFSTVRASIVACDYIDEDTVSRCFSLMQEMKRMEAKDSAFDYDTSFISTETSVSTV